MSGHRSGISVEEMKGATVVDDCELDEEVEFFLISSNLFLIHNFSKYFFNISSEGTIDWN